jgi:hypothetical protein
VIIISATAPPSGYDDEADYDLTDEEAVALFCQGHDDAPKGGEEKTGG